MVIYLHKLPLKKIVRGLGAGLILFIAPSLEAQRAAAAINKRITVLV